MKQVKFFKCNKCGKIIGVIENQYDTPTICCGDPMEELVPNSSGAAKEKHAPVIAVDGNTVTVTVGEVEHPMADDHYIMWIYIKTQNGGQRKALKPGDKPQATFALVEGETLEAAYAYCNKHGLWMTEA